MTNAESKTKKIKLWVTAILTLDEVIIEAAPRTRVILVMQLPIRFPKPILNKPFLKACIDVTSSGREVPVPTIVAPNTDGGSSKKVAMFKLLSTVNLELNTMIAIPIKNLTIKSTEFAFSDFVDTEFSVSLLLATGNLFESVMLK